MFATLTRAVARQCHGASSVSTVARRMTQAPVHSRSLCSANLTLAARRPASQQPRWLVGASASSSAGGGAGGGAGATGASGSHSNGRTAAAIAAAAATVAAVSSSLLEGDGAAAGAAAAASQDPDVAATSTDAGTSSEAGVEVVPYSEVGPRLKAMVQGVRDEATKAGIQFPILHLHNNQTEDIASIRLPLPRRVDLLEVVGILGVALPQSRVLSWDKATGELAMQLQPVKHDGRELNGSVTIRAPSADATIALRWPEVQLFRDSGMAVTDLKAVAALYTRLLKTRIAEVPAKGTKGQSQLAKNKQLQSMGIEVFDGSSPDYQNLDWSCLAGYEHIGEQIEEILLLQLQAPEVYERVVKATRMREESNRIGAVLFSGPPGTGKTTAAKIIATKACVPLIHVPAEKITSKFYGEEQKNLGKVFDAAATAEEGCILFIDEVENLAPTRFDPSEHNCTKKTLAVLLRRLDGFDPKSKITVVCATNRKEQVDPALMSRFATVLTFPLPNTTARSAILQRYAKHLPDSERTELAERSEGLSARDLKNVCENTERHWACQLHQGKTTTAAPDIDAYRTAMEAKIKEKELQQKSRCSANSESASV